MDVNNFFFNNTLKNLFFADSLVVFEYLIFLKGFIYFFIAH